MLVIFIMAVLISLSDVINPPAQSTEDEINLTEEKPVPMLYAVLASFAIPVIFTLGILLIKYVDETLMLDSYDFTFGYWFILSTGLSVFNVVHF